VRHLGLILLCASASLAGCDDAEPGDAGAMASDAGAAADSGAVDEEDAGPTPAEDAGPMTGADAGFDAGRPMTDAGADAGFDAGPPMTDAGFDAGPPADAGALVPADVCDRLCNRLLVCVPMAPPGELGRCITECTADLSDCSTMQLAALRACADAPDACDTDPVSMAPKLLACVMAEACVMG